MKGTHGLCILSWKPSVEDKHINKCDTRQMAISVQYRYIQNTLEILRTVRFFPAGRPLQGTLEHVSFELCFK